MLLPAFFLICGALLATGGCVGVHDDLDGGISLHCTRMAVNILEGEDVSFSVLSGPNDVTSLSTIYMISSSGNEPLGAYSFRPESEGVYTFMAECQGHYSDPVSISAAALQTTGDSFLRRTVIADFTATWCTNCPQMAAALSEAQARSGGRLLKIAVYYLDELQIPAGKALTERFGIAALPAVMTGFDKTLMTSIASSDILLTHFAKWEDNVGELPTPGIALSTTLSGNTLSVKAEVASASTEEYLLGAALLEDGIVKAQTGAGEGYVHNSVLRAMLHAGGETALAESLGTIPEGESKTKDYTIDIQGVPLSSSVLVWVMDTQGNCRSAALCKAGESAPFAYESK